MFIIHSSCTYGSPPFVQHVPRLIFRRINLWITREDVNFQGGVAGRGQVQVFRYLQESVLDFCWRFRRLAKRTRCVIPENVQHFYKDITTYVPLK